MSDHLSRLKYASVEPPPLVWENIERRLNTEEYPDLNCFSQLKDISIDPPEDFLDKLFVELGDINVVDQLLTPSYVVKAKKKKIHFPEVPKYISRRKVYWGMTGIVLACALVLSYFAWNNTDNKEARKPSANQPNKNEQGSFRPSSVSDKSAGELSF